MADNSNTSTSSDDNKGLWLQIMGLIIMALGFIYLMIVFWPAATGEAKSTSIIVHYWIGPNNFWSDKLSSNLSLLLTIGITGALGSLAYVFRSMTWHIGEGSLKSEWYLWYWTKPFLGFILAIIFYLVIRGGFFSFDEGAKINNFSFIAFGGLVGLFTEQALAKLKTIAVGLFEKAPNAKKVPDADAKYNSPKK